MSQDKGKNKGSSQGGKIEKGMNESTLPKFKNPPPPPPPPKKEKK